MTVMKKPAPTIAPNQSLPETAWDVTGREADIAESTKPLDSFLDKSGVGPRCGIAGRASFGTGAAVIVPAPQCGQDTIVPSVACEIPNFLEHAGQFKRTTGMAYPPFLADCQAARR